MEYFQRIDQLTPSESPLVLTIGVFDGVHPGHKEVIEMTKIRSKERDGKSVVLTFSNHPSHILNSRSPVSPILTPEHKISLLSELNIDYLVQIPFTKEFSNQSPKEFIQSIRRFIPFNHLVLGYDARFGKDRQGDQETVRKLGHESGFTVEYIPPYQIDDAPVSSSRIRNAINAGDLTETSKLLGRPYSILSNVVTGHQKGSLLGFPTINIDVSRLCLLPFGVYAAYLKLDTQQIPGVANLGVAPTLKDNSPPLFETFLFSKPPEPLKSPVELFPLQYIRPEKKFPSPGALKEQISSDVETAQNYFRHNL